MTVVRTSRKESDLRWAGAIPAHWDCRKLKHIATATLSNVDKKTHETEEPVRLCNYVDVYYNERIIANLRFMEATATADEIRKFSLRAGDVLITKDSEAWDDIAVPAYVPSDLDGILCGYHLAQIRPRGGEINGEYLFRAFLARGINDQFRVAATGITRYGLGKYWIDNAVFPVPPLEEQRAIARYLDRESARIDALIEKKQRQIELLNEKRTALISHAVTFGLDSSVRMRDSETEWANQIPAHWTILKMRRITLARCDGPFGSGLKSEHYVDSGVRVVRLQNIRFGRFDDYDRSFIDPEHYAALGDHDVRPGDILIAGLGDENNPVGRACIAPPGLGPAMVKADCFRYRVSQDVAYPGYIALQLSVAAKALGGALATGTTRARMNLTETSNRDILLPPLAEQKAIVEYLHRETERIDALVETISLSIERLHEYRTALISNAVTGKIDVRQEVA